MYTEFVEPTIFAYIVFVLIVWFDIGMMDRWLNAVIRYNRDGFQKGWLPWQKKDYKYSDITSIKRDDEKVQIYFGSKKINLDYIVMDSYEFVYYCSAMYKEIHGKGIPKNTSIPRWDIFKGHVKDPESFLLVFIMLFVLMFGTMGYVLYDGYNYVSEQDTTYIEAKINSYEIDDSDLILNSEEQDFIIFRYEEYGDITKNMIAALSETPVLGMNVTEYMSDNVFSGYEVHSVKMGGKNLLSFEETRKNNIVFAYKIVGLFSVVCVPLVVLFVCMVIVGRNPHKYSKRIQRMLFKEGYLR